MKSDSAAVKNLVTSSQPTVQPPWAKKIANLEGTSKGTVVYALKVACQWQQRHFTVVLRPSPYPHRCIKQTQLYIDSWLLIKDSFRSGSKKSTVPVLLDPRRRWYGTFVQQVSKPLVTNCPFFFNKSSCSQCCGSEFGIRDPVLFWPLDPGWKKIRIRDGKNPDTRSGINIPDHFSKIFVTICYGSGWIWDPRSVVRLLFVLFDPGSKICEGNSDPG